MHMQGQPRTMQQAPHYDDLIADVQTFFEHHIRRCNEAGITNQKLLLDPGFGFGKICRTTISFWPGCRNFIVSVCRCWSACRANR